MTVLAEKRHDAEFLISEAPGNLSLDNVTLLSGQVLKTGAVLGKISATSKRKIFDPDAVDGSQTASDILLKDEDTTAGDVLVPVITRLAEVQSALLLWGAGVDSGEKTTALNSLANKFVIARP